jgi:hypothetical protein
MACAPVTVVPLETASAEGLWTMLEIQGTLLAPEDSSAADSRGDAATSEPLLGDLDIEAAIGKRIPCFLRMGTLSVEGDVTKLSKPYALLERLPSETGEVEVGASAAVEEQVDPAFIRAALEHEPFQLFSRADARAEALRKRPRDYGVPPTSASEVRYQVRGFLSERYFVKMKPVRSIPST